MTVKPIKDEKPTLVHRGRYVWAETEVSYPRVSKLLDVMDKPALKFWIAKTIAQVAYDDREQWSQWPEEHAVDYLKKAQWKKSGNAADVGSFLHGMMPDLVGVKDVAEAVEQYENDVLGGEFDVDDELIDRMFAMTAWLKEHCVEMIAQEMTVFRDHTDITSGWAGTMDMLCGTKQWGTVIADLKTGKAAYREAALQMAAYAVSDWTCEYHPSTGDYSKGKLPDIDNLVVVHVTDDGAYSYVVPWSGDERADFIRNRLIKCIDGCSHILSYQEHDPWYVSRVVTTI